MNFYVGTSGYSYKEWKSTFYPVDMSAKGMRHYYGERFRTVEINNTFYRMQPILSSFRPLPSFWPRYRIHFEVNFLIN